MNESIGKAIKLAVTYAVLIAIGFIVWILTIGTLTGIVEALTEQSKSPPVKVITDYRFPERFSEIQGLALYVQMLQKKVEATYDTSERNTLIKKIQAYKKQLYVDITRYNMEAKQFSEKEWAFAIPQELSLNEYDL